MKKMNVLLDENLETGVSQIMDSVITTPQTVDTLRYAKQSGANT